MDTRRRQPRASESQREAAEPPPPGLPSVPPLPALPPGLPRATAARPPPASPLPTLEAVRGCKSVATPAMPEEVSLQPGLPSRSCGKPALGLDAGLTATRPAPGGAAAGSIPPGGSTPLSRPGMHRAARGGVLRLLLSPSGFPRCCHVRSATAGPWVRAISKHTGATVTLFSFQHFLL